MMGAQADSHPPLCVEPRYLREEGRLAMIWRHRRGDPSASALSRAPRQTGPGPDVRRCALGAHSA